MPAVTFGKALDVIKLVSEGDTTLQACEKCFISPVQFRAAMKKEPQLQQMYDEAQEILDDILADSLIDLAKLPSDPKMASVYSTNARFLLERRRPTKYGKVAENLNPDSEANRLLAQALNAAIDRIPQTAAKATPRVIDVVATTVERTAPVVTPAPEVIEEEPPEERDGLAKLRQLGLL